MFESTAPPHIPDVYESFACKKHMSVQTESLEGFGPWLWQAGMVPLASFKGE